MIANISWNATNTFIGNVPASGMSVAATPLPAIRGHGVAADETLQTEVFGRVTEDVVCVVAECDRVAVKHPQHRHHAHRADAHHEHVEHASGADHAAVEERQSRGHQQHQRGTCQHPGGIAGIGLAQCRETHSLSPPVGHEWPPDKCLWPDENLAKWLFQKATLAGFAGVTSEFTASQADAVVSRAARRRRRRVRTARGRRGPRPARPASPARRAPAGRGKRCRPWRCRPAWSAPLR